MRSAPLIWTAVGALGTLVVMWALPPRAAPPAGGGGGGGDASEVARLRGELEALKRRSAPACPTGGVATPAVASFPLTGPRSHPIFITGCGHSGTSIMLRLVGQHPRIFMFTDETNVFYRGTTKERRQKLAELEATFERNRTKEQVRYVEKTPAHVDRIGEALSVRPLGRAVMMTRDGRDVVASLKARKKSPSSEEAKKSKDPYFAYGVERYMYATMKTLEAAEDPRVLVLRYEDLVKNTTGTLKVLFEFLEEMYDVDQILSYHRKQVAYEGAKPDQSKKVSYDKQYDLRAHQQIRVNQINRPLYDGTGRYKQPPPVGLTRDELKQLKANAKFMEYQRRFGYEWPDEL